MRRAIRLIVCLLALAVPAMALAGPFEDGFADLKKEDYAQAAKYFRIAAEQGFAYAQFNLGLMYDNGQGVPRRMTPRQ